MKNLYGIDIELTEERQKLLEGGWEYHRIKSMMENIVAPVPPKKEGSVIFDIGAEQGDMSVLMGKKTGKIVVFEPSPVQWPHIRNNFEANGIKPLHCYAGFVSDVTDEYPEILKYDPEISRDGYPGCAYEELDYTRGFRHLYEERKATLQITLDDYCERTGIYPDMVTMDVEGSECAVLAGMSKVIDKCMPLIYISVHHNFLRESYDKDYNYIGHYFNERGYRAEYLGHDHETHFCYYKKSFNSVREVIGYG